MDDTAYQAMTWGIEPGIDTRGLECRTLLWMERIPGRKRRVKKVKPFYRIPSYEHTDNLLAIPGMKSYEDEVDGHLVTVFMLNKKCVAMWYTVGNTGSFCMEFEWDDVRYAELDPFYPWAD